MKYFRWSKQDMWSTKNIQYSIKIVSFIIGKYKKKGKYN